MAKRLHVIYIPGLGDEVEPKGQLRAVARWPRYGVEAEVLRMRWGDRKPWEPKFKAVLKRIDEVLAEGKDVGLVGASAGASVAINAFAARKKRIVGVVLIAGKVNRPNAIARLHYVKNPALPASVEQCVDSLAQLDKFDRRRILSVYGAYDGYVKKEDSFIPGVQNRRAPTAGHFWNIALQLTVGAKNILNFLKRQQH